MRQVISREVAITEEYLDHQAQLYGPSLPRVPIPWDWPSIVGLGLAVVGVVMLVVEYWRVW